MNIIVCMKQVPDPEGPPSAFHVDSAAKKVIPRGIPPVLSPFDENALEAALRIKSDKGAKITVLSMGKNVAKAVLARASAAGADELVLFEDVSFEDLDNYCTAFGLAAAIKKIGEYDLILCGRQAADSDGGQVGIGVAEMLGIPCISLAQKVEPINGKLRVERLIPDGYEVLLTPIPALVTVSNELYEFRCVSFGALSKAQKRSVTIWNAQDVGVDLAGMRRINLVKLFTRVSGTKSEIISGKTLEEVGVKLALKLREAKVF